MALVSALEQLRSAQLGGYAVPCFDTFEMEGTLGILDALETKRAPGIIGIYDGLLTEVHGRAFATLVRVLAEESTVPVSIILDHGASLKNCLKALRFGFTDVMFDGSRLPFEENVATTRQVVLAAHAVGAAVEAELGQVGSGSDYQGFGAQGKGLTDPDAVERFVAETGVDFLAIAIGTAHGLYAGEPKLALDVLSEIRMRVDIPLVLHGGSGLSSAQFQETIRRGISKVNVFTNLAVEATRRVAEEIKGSNPTYLSVAESIRAGFRDQCEEVLDVFGTTGKAGELGKRAGR